MFGVLVMLMAFACWCALAGDHSGMVAYSKTWQANAGAFWLFRWLGDYFSSWPGIRTDGPTLGRWIILAVLFALAAWQARKVNNRAHLLTRKMGTVVLLMLLLSPTIYPWYYVGLIPLAAVALRPALLLWTPLVLMVYLPQDLLPQWIIIPAIHLPLWALLLTQRSRQNRSSATCLKTKL